MITSQPAMSRRGVPPAGWVLVLLPPHPSWLFLLLSLALLLWLLALGCSTRVCVLSPTLARSSPLVVDLACDARPCFVQFLVVACFFLIFLARSWLLVASCPSSFLLWYGVLVWCPSFSLASYVQRDHQRGKQWQQLRMKVIVEDNYN